MALSTNRGLRRAEPVADGSATLRPCGAVVAVDAMRCRHRSATPVSGGKRDGRRRVKIKLRPSLEHGFAGRDVDRDEVECFAYRCRRKFAGEVSTPCVSAALLPMASRRIESRVLDADIESRARPDT